MNIYHYHVRKTGGTTINFSFLSTVTNDPENIYEKITQTPGHYLEINKKGFTGWNTDVINSGKYFYGWSHTPYYNLNIPNNMITLTCFRDPIKRFISYYNMLMYYKKNNIKHPCMLTEGKWLGENILDFASNVEKFGKPHFKTQINMFSKSHNIDEALENINKIDYILMTETLNNDLKLLSSDLNLGLLKIGEEKRYGHKEKVTQKDIEILRNKFDIEYEMLKKVKMLKK
jgi:hypothetical protein